MPWSLPSWRDFRTADAETRNEQVNTVKNHLGMLFNTIKNTNLEGGIRGDIALKARKFANLTIEGTKEETLRMLWENISQELHNVEDGDSNELYAKNHPENPTR